MNCTLGVPCRQVLEGYGLEPQNAVVLLSAGRCGDPPANWTNGTNGSTKPRNPLHFARFEGRGNSASDILKYTNYEVPPKYVKHP